MSNILSQLLGTLGPAGLEAISKQIGVNDNKQTSNALGGILPVLLGAMANNSRTPSGANGLLQALDADHDGSILDDIAGFAGNFQNGPGQGILKHILGNNRSQVENGLSSKTGLSGAQISNLLQIAAPILLGYLGRQKRQQASNFQPSGLADLLGGMTKQGDKATGLDIGDILNIVGGLSGGSRRGGMAGLIGKLLGR